MTHSELLRICATALDMAEQHGFEPGVQLVWPKGLGRFPMRGELCCVRKGPPLNTFMPGAKHHGRKGSLRSPWRSNLKLSTRTRENAARSWFQNGQ